MEEKKKKMEMRGKEWGKDEEKEGWSRSMKRAMKNQQDGWRECAQCD